MVLLQYLGTTGLEERFRKIPALGRYLATYVGTGLIPSFPMFTDRLAKEIEIFSA